jgi:hypothetical protein
MRPPLLIDAPLPPGRTVCPASKPARTGRPPLRQEGHRDRLEKAQLSNDAIPSRVAALATGTPS